jgi:hypothetical protein
MLGFDAIAALPIADDAILEVAADGGIKGAVRGGQRVSAATGGGDRIAASSGGGARIKVSENA